MKPIHIIVSAVVLLMAGVAIGWYVNNLSNPNVAAPPSPDAAVASKALPSAPQPNPWTKALNVSPGSDVGSIAGAIETAFDEHQLRRRLVLGFWRQGYKADQIAVVTGYRIDTVLKAMKNYESDVKQKEDDINRLVYRDVDIIAPDLAFPDIADDDTSVEDE